MKNDIVVDCNDEGIEFIEAKVSGSMCEFLKKPDEQLRGLLPSQLVSINSIKKGQVIVQVNTFDCHSMAISLCVLHKVADAATITAFIRCWAQTNITVSRTTSIHVSTKLHPTFDSAAVFPPIKQLISPSMDLNTSQKSESVSKLISKRFEFDATMINSVREKILALMADKYKYRRPSRVEIVSALIWKSFVKLSTSSVMVRHAVNLRKIIDPPLPDVSFGNIIAFTKLVVRRASEKTTTQESSYSILLHEELNEFVVQLRESVSNYDLGPENTENEERHLHMSSWCNFGTYDIDFGWGKPIWVTTVAPILSLPDLFLMNDTRCGKGIQVWGNLVEEDMECFQQNLSELLDRI